MKTDIFCSSTQTVQLSCFGEGSYEIETVSHWKSSNLDEVRIDDPMRDSIIDGRTDSGLYP